MWKNRLKPYDILSGEALEEIGVDFLHDRARELFGRGFVMEMAAKELIAKRKREIGDD
jgi:hypothetical protein